MTKQLLRTSPVTLVILNLLLALLCGVTLPALAQSTVYLAQTPLLALKSASGLVMLTMSRDQRLFYQAYNDSTDINGDGVIDVGFKPGITYYGYFASDRCYFYDTGNTRFSPKTMANASTGCFSGSGDSATTPRWHGNWLNWATMSRMDTLRRVLYGGYRLTDPASGSSPTVLQGAFIPRDAHVWGKEYRPVAGRDLNVYLIQNYTPLAAPIAGRQHLFIVKSDNSTAPAATGTGAYPFPAPEPKLRVVTNASQVTDRIWNWASGVGPALASDNPNFSVFGGGTYTSNAYTIRVEVCVALSGLREAGCTGYPANAPTIWKPTGTLHDYAVNDALKFGLLTGSYQNNYSGGVIRRNMASFNDEIKATTGQWQNVTEGTASVPGIARTMDRLVIYGWDGSGAYHCGTSHAAPRNQGACPAWGSPLSEMMYEGLRYFSGRGAATSAFITGLSATSSADSRLGLPLIGTATSPWLNPYRATTQGGNPTCSRPVQLVVADPISSFDSDQLPGAYFPLSGGSSAVSSSDLTGWGAATLKTLTDTLWATEGLGTRNIIIGQSGSISDGNPTAKPASSFYSIRGLAQDAAQAQGSYYAMAVGKFGRSPGIDIGNPTGNPSVAKVSGQQVDTISVALGTVVPRIRIPSDINRTRYATLIPMAKSVANLSISPAPGQYQATGTITGFFLDTSANTTGLGGPDYDASVNGGRPYVTYAVHFSNSDEGTENASDASVRYTVFVNSSGNLVVQIDPVQTNISSIQMQIGYSISGTSKDGMYLDMRTQASSQVYYLDTLTSPAQQDPAPVSPPYRTNASALPATVTSRTLSFNTTGIASDDVVPRDPLWYAAKYGGAGVVDTNGDPSNYFRVSSPADLPAQMGKALRTAASLAAVSSTSVVGLGQRSLGSGAVYQANFDSLTWSSRLYAFKLDEASSPSPISTLWEASSLIAAPAARVNLYLGRGGTTTPTRLVSGGYTTALNSAEQSDFGSATIYQYLLGDKSNEERKGGKLRNRGSTSPTEFGSVLGDIVNADPQLISRKDYGYAASDATYTPFLNGLGAESLAVGSNSGFFHIFDASPTATGGQELLAFMPQAARAGIKDLASPAYTHRYLVDGPIGLGHAKIQVPGDSLISWRSIAVATGGAGVRTVFAINVTSQAYSASSILWEINANSTFPSTFSGASGSATLGNVLGRPFIGKLKNGTWVAIFGNGFNSTAGTANLYVVRLRDGAILAIIPTRDSIAANGLAHTAVVLSSGGNKDTIEYVYGADYKGNLWRFDLSGSSISSWPSTAALVYSTPTSPTTRPVTAEIIVGDSPVSANTPAGGKMIYFGTGSYLNASDTSSTGVQAVYGIYDDLLWASNSSPAVTEAKLNAQTISMPSPASDARTTSSVSTPWYLLAGSMKGWKLELTGTHVAVGERVIAPPVRFTRQGKVDALLFSSIVPGTDPCLAGLDLWITGIDALTGGYSQVFDQLIQNSIKVTGGSLRGGVVLSDGRDSTLYISQTVFNQLNSTRSYSSSVGGQLSTTINGVVGQTQLLSIKMVKQAVAAPTARQVWRQLK